MRREYRGAIEPTPAPTGFWSKRGARIAQGPSLLRLGYFLLRWLYFKLWNQEVRNPESEPSA
jgi:hypothetical protein